MRLFADCDRRAHCLGRTAAPRLAAAASPVHRLLWGGAVGVVQRIFDPRRSGSQPAPPLSAKAERLLERLAQLDVKVVFSKVPYTRGTRDVIERLVSGMEYRIVKVEENGDLNDAEKAFLHKITGRYLKEFEKEVARSPKTDPYQEGNIWGIWRRWYAEIQQWQETLERLQWPSEEPGDYNRPENPLDLPETQDEGSSQRIA
jgi:hypothetical protein